MQIEVLDAFLSTRFKPKKPAVAIRICGGPNSLYTDQAYQPLRESPLWIARYTYGGEFSFDDTDPQESTINNKHGLKLFTKEIGRKILEDLIPTLDRAQIIMINCYAGQGRSAGVASGLNN